MINLDPYTFFFELPLYTSTILTEENQNKMRYLLTYERKLDAYNPYLKENTTYEVSKFDSEYYLSTLFQNGGIRTATLTCVRTNEKIYIYVYYDPRTKTLQKIGQFPSIAYLHISKIKEYDKVLSREQLKEFTRAIGLVANGVGIGSFVYLRRIFEDLIDDALNQAKIDGKVDENKFVTLKMADKIDSLKDYLPKFLVDNKSLYGILSIGIHSLKEEECLAYFEIVKTGIELILDEKVERVEKEKKLNEAKKKISALSSQLSKQ